VFRLLLLLFSSVSLFAFSFPENDTTHRGSSGWGAPGGQQGRGEDEEEGEQAVHLFFFLALQFDGREVRGKNKK